MIETSELYVFICVTNDRCISICPTLRVCYFPDSVLRGRVVFHVESKNMIVVVATVTCVPGKREAFLAEFHKIVPQVLNHVGCMEYSPTIDVESHFDAQHRNENRVTIVEKWSDLAALDRHQNSAYMDGYRANVADLVQSKELRILSATC